MNGNRRDPASSGVPQEGPPADRMRAGLGAALLHHTVTALLLVMVLALGTWTYLTFRHSGFSIGSDAGQRQSVSKPFATVSQLQRVEFALKVYFRLHERFPAGLDELVDMGLLQPSDLYYPWGAGRLQYQRRGGTFELSLTAPETADD